MHGDNRYSDRSSFRDGHGSFGNSSYGSGGGRNDSMGGLGSGLRNIQWDISKLPVFEKNFYIEHPVVRARTEEDAEKWRRDKEIMIKGRGIPKPVMTFEEASMPEYVLREVLKQKFDKRRLSIIIMISHLCSDSYSESGLAHGSARTRYDWNFRHWFWQNACVFASRHDSH